MSNLQSPISNFQSLETLIRVNTGDMLKAIGLEHPSPLQTFARWASRPLATAFAQQLLEFDRVVGKQSLKEGARFMLPKHIASISATGHEHMPPTGPVLLLSNHPGLSDALSLFATLPRDTAQLRIVALVRDFLSALPNTQRHLLQFPDDPTKRAGLLRIAIRHLKEGGVLLTYPAGQIEPDPALEPEAALNSLKNWSTSFELFARSVSDLTIVPVIVRGVVEPRAYRNPLTSLRRAWRDRSWLAATLQVIVPTYHQVHVRVAYGQPIRNTADVTQAVLAEARRLISNS